VLSGDVAFGMEDSPRLFDNRTVEYVVEVPARKEHRWVSDATFHMGKNAKRTGVRLAK
jgi:hypothetical protein